MFYFGSTPFEPQPKTSLSTRTTTGLVIENSDFNNLIANENCLTKTVISQLLIINHMCTIVPLHS